MSGDELVERAIDYFAWSEELPVEAIEATLHDWELLEFSRHFGALLHGYVSGVDLSERTEAAMQIVIHLLGEMEDTASFPDLCALALDTDRFISALGDESTVLSYPSVLISTFNGDPVPLHRLIETPSADDYARSDALRVLAYLARSGRLPEREVYEYLASLPERLQTKKGSFVWLGYAMAVAGLGFSGLARIVDAAFNRGDIAPEALTPAIFWQQLRDAQQNPGDLSNEIWERLQPFGSTIDYLEAIGDIDEDEPPTVPVQPIRTEPKIGRNDPCPCGSGKKFKKCCLVQA